MSRARKAYAHEAELKPCSAIVRLAGWNTVTKLGRIREAARAGRDPEICGRRAAWAVDGVPLCLNHAGQAALRVLACIEVVA